jgi:hypothetical protein
MQKIILFSKKINPIYYKEQLSKQPLSIVCNLKNFYRNDSQSVVLGPTISAALGNFLGQ